MVDIMLSGRHYANPDLTTNTEEIECTEASVGKSSAVLTTKLENQK